MFMHNMTLEILGKSSKRFAGLRLRHNIFFRNKRKVKCNRFNETQFIGNITLTIISHLEMVLKVDISRTKTEKCKSCAHFNETADLCNHSSRRGSVINRFGYLKSFKVMQFLE